MVVNGGSSSLQMLRCMGCIVVYGSRGRASVVYRDPSTPAGHAGKVKHACMARHERGKWRMLCPAQRPPLGNMESYVQRFKQGKEGGPPEGWA